jgi:hypothetical protein
VVVSILGAYAAVLELLKRRFARTDGLRSANLLLAFHGCSSEAAARIAANGFANIATRDNGFFGNGIYLTTHAEYACAYATGSIDGEVTVAPNAELPTVSTW